MSKPLFIIVGYTASQKQQVATQVCKMAGLKRVITSTTRPPRNDEDNNSYHFIPVADFYALQKVDSEKINGNFFGVTASDLAEGDVVVLSLDGCANVKRHCEVEGRDVHVIGLDVSMAVQMERMKDWGWTMLRSRDAIAEDAIAYAPLRDIADVTINAGDFDAVCSRVLKYINRWLEG